MFEDEVIEFCIRHKIKVEQYYFMWLLLKKDWSQPFDKSLAKRYLKIAMFTAEDIKALEKKNYIVNMNVPPNTLPELYLVDDKIANEMFAGDDAGEQLFKAYPATFPLSNGQSFVARAGADKDDLINMYLSKIHNSPQKHQFVMGQLRRYKELVKDGKINGNKLSDFIKMELWDVIAEIDNGRSKPQSFGRNI
jgi:hypothetical protein